MSEWWVNAAHISPQQRAVQAAHHTGFWRGFRRGVIWANVIGLPPYTAFLIWWYLT